MVSLETAKRQNLAAIGKHWAQLVTSDADADNEVIQHLFTNADEWTDSVKKQDVDVLLVSHPAFFLWEILCPLTGVWWSCWKRAPFTGAWLGLDWGEVAALIQLSKTPCDADLLRDIRIIEANALSILQKADKHE